MATTLDNNLLTVPLTKAERVALAQHLAQVDRSLSYVQGWAWDRLDGPESASLSDARKRLSLLIAGLQTGHAIADP